MTVGTKKCRKGPGEPIVIENAGLDRLLDQTIAILPQPLLNLIQRLIVAYDIGNQDAQAFGMIRDATGCHRNLLGKHIDQTELVHEILDHRQYVDLFEPGFKLFHNASLFAVMRRWNTAVART